MKYIVTPALWSSSFIRYGQLPHNGRVFSSYPHLFVRSRQFVRRPSTVHLSYAKQCFPRSSFSGARAPCAHRQLCVYAYVRALASKQSTDRQTASFSLPNRVCVSRESSSQPHCSLRFASSSQVSVSFLDREVVRAVRSLRSHCVRSNFSQGSNDGQ